MKGRGCSRIFFVEHKSVKGVKGLKGAKGVKGGGVKSEKGAKGVKGMAGGAATSFEDLHVYQRARELTNAVYALTRQGPFSRDFGIVQQIRKASVSVMSNIAEGFERGTTTEFIHYLFIAKGSCGELRAQLQVAADQKYIDAAEYIRLKELCRQIGGMISNFIAHLQGSDYRGEKFSKNRVETTRTEKRPGNAAPASRRMRAKGN